MLNELNDYIMYFLFTFFCFFVLTNGELTCYECGPSSPEKCESPDQHNVSVQNCSESTVEKEMTNIMRDMNLTSTDPPLCYYLYLDAGILNVTGYYRGCSNHKEGVLDFCKKLQTVMKTHNKTMVGCKTCRENTCNGASFASNINKTNFTVNTRKATTGNRAQTLSVGMYVVMAGWIFVIPKNK